MDTEIWKDIPWYEWLYQVSSLWNVKSLFRYKKILNPSLWKYKRFGLTKKGVIKHISSHRLVALAFIPNIENKPEVNHIDWDKYNNCVENLEWVSRSENEKHSYRTLWKKWWRNNTRIIQYDLYGNKIKEFESQAEAVKETRVPQWNIWKCCNWKRNHAWWYKWAYS